MLSARGRERRQDAGAVPQNGFGGTAALRGAVRRGLFGRRKTRRDRGDGAAELIRSALEDATCRSLALNELLGHFDDLLWRGRGLLDKLLHLLARSRPEL